MPLGTRRVLTIAGSDSSGGAGIQADLKVFADLQVYGLCAVTAVTAQDSRGICKINKVPPRIIAAQIDAVMRDIGADACKIGMLYSPQAVSAVAGRIARREIRNVVVDPVVFAKDGTRLLCSRAVKRMRLELLPKSLLVTPNLADAAELAGFTVANIAEMREAAKKISDFGADSVLVKGGHLNGDPIDLLYDGMDFTEILGKRVEGPLMRGTGCILSAAIAARIALGDKVLDACVFAKKYVENLIQKSIPMGKGKTSFFAGWT